MKYTKEQLNKYIRSELSKLESMKDKGDYTKDKGESTKDKRHKRGNKDKRVIKKGGETCTADNSASFMNTLYPESHMIGKVSVPTPNDFNYTSSMDHTNVMGPMKTGIYSTFTQDNNYNYYPALMAGGNPNCGCT